MRCCVDLVKFFLFIFNFLCFLGFCGLFGGSIYVLLYGENTFIAHHIQPTLDNADPTNSTYFLLILICLIVTAFLAVFTCLGCCGAACKSGCMLGSFIVILFVLFGGSVGALIFIHTQFGWQAVQEVMEQEMARNIPRYSQDHVLTYQFWNWLQPSFQCCGVVNNDDWSGVAGLEQNWKVPESCCDQPTQTKKDCMYEPNSDNSFTEGCAPKILLYVQILIYGIPSLMFLSLVFAFIVSASNSSAERRRKEAHDHETRDSQYSVGADDDFSQHHSGYGGYGGYGASAPMTTYSDNPPYNPGYGEVEVSPYYGGNIGHYPTGTVPPPNSHQPLLHQAPPPYNEVVSSRRK